MNTTVSTEPLPLGRTLITPQAKETLHPQDVLSALWRHAREPWGPCFDPAEAREASSQKEDRRLVSNHRGVRGDAFRVATETAAGFTIVLLSHETDLSEASLVEDWVCHIGCPHCGG